MLNSMTIDMKNTENLVFIFSVAGHMGKALTRGRAQAIYGLDPGRSILF